MAPTFRDRFLFICVYFDAVYVAAAAATVSTASKIIYNAHAIDYFLYYF